MSNAAGSPSGAGPLRARPQTDNERLCAEFRKLLTEGFYVIDEDGVVLEDQSAALAQTKPWRGEVWKAFRALEDRLCPVAKFERTGQP